MLLTNGWVQDVGVTENYVKLSMIQRSFYGCPFVALVDQLDLGAAVLLREMQ